MSDLIPVTSFHYLLHPYNTALVTCCDAQGNANIITIAWLIPVSVHPPMVGICMRSERHSYGFIQETGEFVVNFAPYEIAQQALFCGRKTGRDVDKFAATGLTPIPAQQVRAPVIAECPAHLECRLVQVIPTGDHHLLTGEVLGAYARPGVLGEDGLWDLEHARPLLHLGRNRFTTPRAETIEPELK